MPNDANGAAGDLAAAAPLIVDGQVQGNPWRLLDDDAPLGDAPALVSAARWQARREELMAALPRLGVVVASPEELDALGADLRLLPLICVRLQPFTDGRGFSLGRLLRTRHGYGGQLRALGATRDQLRYLCRCGFDAFELTAGADAAAALQSLGDLPQSYQHL